MLQRKKGSLYREAGAPDMEESVAALRAYVEQLESQFEVLQGNHNCYSGIEAGVQSKQKVLTASRRQISPYSGWSEEEHDRFL